MSGKLSEVELCAIVRDWLLLDGWDVHQEVTTWGGTVDLLAVKGKLLWAIEAKVQLSFHVCAQALERKASVHQVSIAVPKHNYFAMKIAERFGFGYLEVHRGDAYVESKVYERVRPSRMHRPFGGNNEYRSERSYLAERITSVREFLSDDTRSFAKAGSAGTPRWTHWKRQEREVQRILQKHGPRTVKELYALLKERNMEPTSPGTIYSWFRHGWVANVERVSEKPLKWGYVEILRTQDGHKTDVLHSTDVALASGRPGQAPN